MRHLALMVVAAIVVACGAANGSLRGPTVAGDVRHQEWISRVENQGGGNWVIAVESESSGAREVNLFNEWVELVESKCPSGFKGHPVKAMKSRVVKRGTRLQRFTTHSVFGSVQCR